MFCKYRDNARACWQGLSQFSDQASNTLLHSQSPWFKTPYAKATGAMFEIIHRWTRPNKKPQFDIASVAVNNKKYSVKEAIVFEKPFCQLKVFQKVGFKQKQPVVLIVAPLSGHYATLVKDTISTMLKDHVVYLTDWKSAYNVPLDQGDFDLDSYVDYLDDFLKFLGPRVNMVAVCQPCIPVLMITAHLAQQKARYQPAAMILMGGPVDTRVNPTIVNQMAEKLPISWFKRHMISTVPAYADGAGRQVAPGNLILGGFIQMNLGAHVKKHVEHIQNVVQNKEKPSALHRKFYDEYLSVMDLPANYFIQTVDKIFKQHLIARRNMDYNGVRLNFNAVKDVALMTIEGENDDITGIGQTYAAHSVCPNIPKEKRHHFLRTNIGHYGLFSGSRWRKDIYPQIRDFIQKNQLS